MQQTRKTETMIGAAVVLTGAVLIALLYSGGSKATASGTLYTARFNRAEGIGIGSHVRLSGIQVGRVSDQALDESFRAVLSMRIDPTVQLSADTAAVIHTDGLLGAKFIALQPGADDAVLPSGGEIPFTQDSVAVEDLLETIIAQGKAMRAPAQAK